MAERISLRIGSRPVSLPVLHSPELTRAAALRVEAHLAAVEKAAQRLDTVGFVYETACYFAEQLAAVEKELAALRTEQRSQEDKRDAALEAALEQLQTRLAALLGPAE